MEKLKELVKDRVVRFRYYRDKELWYEVAEVPELSDHIGVYRKYKPKFLFSIPLEDTGSATFSNEDRAIYFMRWIRKALENGYHRT